MRKLANEEIDRLSLGEFQSAPKHPITALLQDVRSIHNVGSMFRTADAAAIEKLILTGITGTPDNRGIRKTALGAEATVAWSYAENAVDVVRAYRAHGYRVVALEQTDESRRVTEIGADSFPLLLVVGNEIDGVGHDVLEETDMAIEIPQYGTKHSLNVSVAFGIATFGLVEQYLTASPSMRTEPRRSGNL